MPFGPFGAQPTARGYIAAVLLLITIRTADAQQISPASFAWPTFDQASRAAQLNQPLEIDGRTRMLILDRFEVFAPGARLVSATENGEVSLPHPRVVTYSGGLADEPNSTAFLSISPSAVYGFVSSAAGTHAISTGPIGSDLAAAVENLANLPTAGTPFQCESGPEMQIGPPAAPGEESRGTPPCRTAILAIETDYEYTANLFGGNSDAAAAYAATLFGSVSAIYTRDLNVRLQIGYLRLWETSSDPWTGASAGPQLDEFRNYWNANMFGVYRHLAHFVSGRSLGGGVAWLSVVCNPSYGYAVSGINGYFPHPIVMNHGANWDLMVTAHELGHNFGAPHTHDMVPQVDNCANGDCSVAPNGTIMSYCHFCPNGLGDVRMEFHLRSISEAMLPHLAGSCALTDPPAEDTALWFDGVNDYGSVPALGPTLPQNEVTVEFWQYADDAWQRSSFGLNPDSANNRFQAHVPWQDGRVYWDFGNINSSGRLSYQPPVSIVGSWQHFAFVTSQSGNYMRIFRNGILEAERTGRSSYLGGNFEFRLGSLGTGNFFRGKLNEFRIWNVARTPAEIAANYNQVLVPAQNPGLLYYWRMEEGAGATTTDLVSSRVVNLNGTQWIQNDSCAGDTGQCLFFDGGCLTTTRDACGHFGGSYQGDGTLCDGGPYPEPGGCCLPASNGLCAYLFEIDCAAIGGTFSGEGSSCTGVGPFEGHALEFDGVNDRVTFGNPASLNFNGAITIEAWIRPEATNGLRQILAHGATTFPPREGGLRINAGMYEIFSNNGSVHRATAVIPPEDIGRWVHLAGTHDGTTWRIHRNGVLAGASADTTGAVTSSGDWGLGGRAATNDRLFDGQIDEVRVWNIARTPAQILAGMTQPLAGNEAGLVGYWRLDAGVGTSVTDSSAFGNNGGFVNDPQWRATTACATPCLGDLDGDGSVSLADLTQLLAHFGDTSATPSDGDLDGDQDVDLADLTALLSAFGVFC